MFVDADDVATLTNSDLKLLAVEAMRHAEQEDNPHRPFFRAMAYALVRARQERARIESEYLNPPDCSTS
ncbi:MAG: hypothetical protein IPH27_06435 [Actinomycetales bacterium]|nr:hypothetical protein [Candidatus Phosphoribacter baldrii]MBP8881829.1 hypothetical protein [Dermatophilaceae bacterium]